MTHIITLACEDGRPYFAGNTHRVVLKEETADAFIGWPDPTDSRNSEHWNPNKDKPLRYPKFAWVEVQS